MENTPQSDEMIGYVSLDRFEDLETALTSRGLEVTIKLRLRDEFADLNRTSESHPKIPLAVPVSVPTSLRDSKDELSKEAGIVWMLNE